jgi:hypothetical protein
MLRLGRKPHTGVIVMARQKGFVRVTSVCICWYKHVSYVASAYQQSLHACESTQA